MLFYIMFDLCLECGGNFYVWCVKNKDGFDRCLLICMECGYKVCKKVEDFEIEKMFNDSLKVRVINYLKYSLFYIDKNLINCCFKIYKIVDIEIKFVFEIVNWVIIEIFLNKLIYMIFLGKSGVGKSYLVMLMVWEVLEKLNYDKCCLFISYVEFLE